MKLGLTAGLGAVAMLPAVLATTALLRLRQSPDAVGLWQGFARSPFLESLLPSFAYAILVGCVTTSLALLLNSALMGGRRSSLLRIGGLSIGVFLPPVLLVLMGATLLRAGLLSRPPILFLAHTVAVYPSTALILTLWFEPFFISVFEVSKMRAANVISHLGLVIRLRGFALASVALIGSSLAFQDYLINLTLRQRPSTDALVSLMALFPQTGVRWPVAMAAVLVIFTAYGFIAALVARVIRF